MNQSLADSDNFHFAGKGVVVKWQRIRRQNHWLDALYNASPTSRTPAQ